MRFLPLTVICVLLGCPPPSGGDYLNLSAGSTWEYYLIEGGEEGEYWTLEALDAGENPTNQRGDIYFRLSRVIPDGVGDDEVLPQRRFNVRHVQDLTGSAPVSIGWDYRWVASQEEGLRSEYFVKSPGSAADWSDRWEFEYDEASGSDFEHRVETQRCEDEVVTSYGVFADCIEVTRSVDTINFDLNDNPEPALTTVHEEVWAEGVGLIRYSILSSDDQRSTMVLRTTDSESEE